MTQTKITDVLVLGAGLSGFRAAISALEATPELSVTLVFMGHGPSGSSFANMNNALGMQVPKSRAEQDNFVREAARVAPPGMLDTNLAAVMAREAEARYRDLLDMGVSPARSNDREQREKGCFSKEPRAFIFKGLNKIHSAFHAKFAALGGRLLQGCEVEKILLSEGRAVGAQLTDKAGGRTVLIRAKAVVMCLGGPASLFGRDMSGPDNSGYSYGLLSEAGAEMGNAGFIQFMWMRETENGPEKFISPTALIKRGMAIQRPNGGKIRIPDDLPESISRRMDEMRLSRGGHCPFGYGLEDSALDLLLLDNAGPDGMVSISGPKEPFRAHPTAHAGNGGAVVDEHGQTTVPGLLACGECATGMHGANRLGGAMILATQVFGHRAGKKAAKMSARIGTVNDEMLRESFPGNRPAVNNHDCSQELALIRNGMQKHAILGGRPGISGFHDILKQLSAGTKNRRVELMAKSSLAVTSHLLSIRR